MLQLFRRFNWNRLRVPRWRYGVVVIASLALCLMMPVMLPSLVPPGAIAQPSVTAPQLMQQGRAAYAAGQYVPALEQWQQAAQLFMAQAERGNQASALGNVALAHLQLGQYESAEAAIAAAKTTLEGLPSSNHNRRVLAQVLSTEGQFFMARGNPTAALAALDGAIAQYQDLAEPAALIRAQLNQVNIYRVQGRTLDMRRILDDIIEQIEVLPDTSSTKAAGYRQLGIALQKSGDISQAESAFQTSLKLAEQLGTAADISAAWLHLGNLADPNAALTSYQQAIATAPTPLLRLQAQLNTLNSLIQLQDLAAARMLVATLLPQLNDLPPSRSTFFLRTNLVSQALVPASFEAETPLLAPDIISDLLAITLEQAEALGDAQAQTYSLGYQGHLAERQQQWARATTATQKATVLAQAINDDKAQYQ